MNALKTLRYFNTVANAWLHDLEQTNEHDLLVNPSETQWSISELYDHVMKVTRTYQIPNFKKSLSDTAERKASKNAKAFAIFNLGLKKINVKIKMENFPADLVQNFTPVKQHKDALIKDFKCFINEVNHLKAPLLKSNRNHKQHHPMFGDISTKEWFALIAFHMVHHEKQKQRLHQFLQSK